MSVSPWIRFPQNDSTKWPANEDRVWIRMRDWTRQPVKAEAATNDAGDLFFYILDEDDNRLAFTVFWPDVDAWHPV
jgi:hypothetical protein